MSSQIGLREWWKQINIFIEKTSFLMRHILCMASLIRKIVSVSVSPTLKIYETPLHPEKSIAQCHLWYGGTIPYQGKNEEGRTVTGIRESYCSTLTYSFSPINLEPWPPRFYDLTSLGYFLFGHIKSQVYGNKPRTTYQSKWFPASSRIDPDKLVDLNDTLFKS